MRDNLSLLHFEPDPEGLRCQGYFVAHVPPGIADYDELMQCLAAELHFPEHFGGNWNALDDCLGGFWWMENKGIALIHQDLPLASDVEQCKTYIDVLLKAVEAWKPDDDHELIVVFPSRCRPQMESLVHSDPLRGKIA